MADRSVPFTMLIGFELPPEHQAVFAERLSAQIAESVAVMPGFLSATVHASADHRTVVNYAQWRSAQAWEEATGLTVADAAADRAWTESQTKGHLFGDPAANPVAALLAEFDGRTRGVTAFDTGHHIAAAPQS